MSAPKYDSSLCWLRRDLRITDHAALSEATRLSKKVTVVFVFDSTILSKLSDRDDRRVTFILRSLEELQGKLEGNGSALVVLKGDPTKEIPALARKLSAQAVFTHRDYEPQAKLRDDSVDRALAEFDCRLLSFKDQVIFEKREIVSGAGTPFKVFTPYKNAWLKKLKDDPYLTQERAPDLSRLTPLEDLEPHLCDLHLSTIGFKTNSLWLDPGEQAARARLEAFLPKIRSYATDRNIPGIEGTSGLSVHLRFGTIAIRELVRAAMKSNSKGAEIWLSELVWRDFYMMILDQFPHVVGHSFKPEYDSIVWPGRDNHFTAWCEGQTGYPIVDAAMRHFNQTGWMHNRLRMITASFLTKDLLVDWRKGEAYFARKLLDFDLSANNGGWQWSASTGCDAQPYFRIFNPVTQSKTFDPEGNYIREHCPELKGFSSKSIHFPADADLFERSQAVCTIGQDYPAPIVVHSEQREKALKLFSNQRSNR